MSERMLVFNQSSIGEAIRSSRDSLRGRTQRSLPGDLGQKERLQAIINAIQPKSYMRPHKHEDPDKTEIMTCVEGRVAVVNFNDDGRIFWAAVLSKDGPDRITRMPPGAWHTSVALEPNSVILSVISGPYNEQTHKKFPDWAPVEEDEQAGQEYLQKIRKQLQWYESTT